MQAKAKLVIKSAEERSFGDATNAPKLGKYSAIVAYEGDLVGEGTVAELKTYLRRNFSMIYGLERFRGRLGEKSGTFVFQRTGKVEENVLTMRWDIIPHSGTGDLKNLIGAVQVQGEPGAKEFSIALEYELDGATVV